MASVGGEGPRRLACRLPSRISCEIEEGHSTETAPVVVESSIIEGVQAESGENHEFLVVL